MIRVSEEHDSVKLFWPYAMAPSLSKLMDRLAPLLNLIVRYIDELCSFCNLFGPGSSGVEITLDSSLDDIKHQTRISCVPNIILEGIPASILPSCSMGRFHKGYKYI